MFRNFTSTVPTVDHAQSPTPIPLDEARELIGRYPDLSGAETDRLISLYRAFSALEMALVLSDKVLAPRLDRFAADFRSKIRPPFRHYAALLLYAVLGVASLAWAAAVAS